VPTLMLFEGSAEVCDNCLNSLACHKLTGKNC